MKFPCYCDKWNERMIDFLLFGEIRNSFGEEENK